MMEMITSRNGDDGSQDLFSSQDTSQGTNINEQIDITLQLTEFVWVQCDHPNCQKWRRVAAANADDLGDDPWYCSMNPDRTVNSCDAEEEDYHQYDRMAKKVGIKFVMSMLNVGTLVWAKTTGYCRWPGIVTPDPMTGVHIHLDIDGDPHSYHIEYLGNPHTHSWVTAKYVDVYGHKGDAKVVIENRGRKKSIKKSTAKCCSQNKVRNSYRRVRVEEVMREADYLLKMTCDERMNFCIFKYDPKKAESLEFEEQDLSSLKNDKKCSNCGVHPSKRQKISRKVKESNQGLLGIVDNYAVARKTEEKNRYIPRKKRAIKKRGLKDVLNSPAREMSMVELTAGVKNGNSEGVPKNVTDSPNQFSQSKLNISSSMVNKTKEEKFKIDIDVYLKNEKAFEHDVRRFMTLNGRSIRTSPTWHNVPISLFQLFLAVYERGGFLKVCESKCWTRVYKELTDMHHVTTGSVVKHYYERNLYPYELFISGQDYSVALEKFRVKQTKRELPVTKPPVDANNNVENGTSDYASYCSDIEAILGQLDDDYKASLSDENNKTEMKKKLGIGLTFHDESPSSPSLKFASVPSEFDQKASDLASTDSPAQRVPDSHVGDDDLNLDDVEDKILTEMKALEDQMREMHDELDEMI